MSTVDCLWAAFWWVLRRTDEVNPASFRGHRPFGALPFDNVSVSECSGCRLTARVDLPYRGKYASVRLSARQTLNLTTPWGGAYTQHATQPVRARVSERVCACVCAS